MTVAIETIEHRNGIEWHRAPKPFRIHRHRWQTRATTENGYHVIRCACGAFYDGGWFYLHPDKPRTRWWPL